MISILLSSSFNLKYTTIFNLVKISIINKGILNYPLTHRSSMTQLNLYFEGVKTFPLKKWPDLDYQNLGPLCFPQ